MSTARHFASPAEALGYALTLHQSGRLAECGAVCRAILAVQPDHHGASFLLGVAAFALGRVEESRRCLAVTIALKPDLADACLNLALLLRRRGRLAEAAALQARALRLASGQADAGPVIVLGAMLRELGRTAATRAVLRRAVALAPDDAEAWRESGHGLRDGGELAAAATAYGRAYRLDPSRTESLGDQLHAALSHCDWSAYDALCRQVLAVIDSGRGIALPLLTLLIDSSAAQQDRAARHFHRAVVQPAAPPQAATVPATPSLNAPSGDGGRLTVAYLSADFHEHATAYLAAELFERHDRESFRVVACSYGPDDGSPMRRRLEAAFDAFHDVRGCDADAVQASLAAEGVHILVDLKGYTRHARFDLLARRLAPVQVAYLGYPGTMGGDAFDYVIGDRFVTPPEHQPHYRERLVIMPDSYQVNDRRRPLDGPVPDRAACGLPPDGFVFCAFNAPFKITPSLFALWMRVLGRVPGSVLWLQHPGRAGADNLRREAARRGVDPDRLVFAPHKPQAEHLARYRLADLFLDSFPYTGHTTVSDALWMGLPVVTRIGDTFASRVAAGLLNAAGLPETVTTSFDGYEALAVRLAGDPATLDGYRRRLTTARATAPLFDTPRFTHHLESAYRTMWGRHAAGLPPASFTVPPL
ncbi:putative O-linked N-acetylglucosamine transferase (SPINDLY family) [Azospirillum sp. OGB3]|uniref:O-linked N-acetylglucosamine transferase, SPINDLY family protein n=1 Tax=Azospirillum sp. OGB3 TaxID=2587012 RepID=UPI00160685FA|nr:tetratricopeptide repeat protein [Azospirillum sp. OGB3]MBB3268524.1 putative O-linked N-acetylglucosamine transferase (SPINDLY family) [Azospirillum sp. OGB3]